MQVFNHTFQTEHEAVCRCTMAEEQSRVSLERQVRILAHALEAADQLISAERVKRQQAETQVQELQSSLYAVLSANALDAADVLLSEERVRRQQAEAQIDEVLNTLQSVLNMISRR